jgi:hypothetical protein
MRAATGISNPVAIASALSGPVWRRMRPVLAVKNGSASDISAESSVA